ncbi:bifunctional 2-polyprenyl-6-hydroxyphenol methylase/3-demethylubiquinol 3-O-methyltransferase UbiG [Kitasatospora sp. MMS16-BH015]|uniref:class I SAM-dependent methyltransferase n=1 Tax=Kitasatospora sp. MMS16-BH015 TaxID=2018025 RepID=UPI000CF257A2|nr:class I SAM-dependent methyltransferase [Kitasatospora sp. MMS16-BH015]
MPFHLASEFYDLPGFIAGRDSLWDFEVAEVGEVTGKRLLHLQCHIGLDTLSWARRGARVTGLDFSEPAVVAAGELAERIGVTDARFVASDVYAAAEALDGETFDIVCTGFGALCWLPDLDRWARTVARLLAPGGFLYLAEYHPFADILGADGLTVEQDYFNRKPNVYDEPGTYTDLTGPTEATVTVEWQHGLGEVVTALVEAGLRPEFLHEHDHAHFRLPAGGPVPRVYSIRAAK